MNEEEFRKYLKRRGKKPAVVDRNVSVLKDFISYLLEKREKNLDGVTIDDIDAFVMGIESKKQSAKGYLYVLMNYFHFLGNKDLLNHTKTLREERTKKTRRIFPIREFLNINQDYVKKLATIGIKNVECMHATVNDFISCDAVAFGSPNYFSYMAGIMKDFFDKALSIREKVGGKPSVAFTSGGGSSNSALLSLERMISSFRLEKVTDGVISEGETREEKLRACKKLGENTIPIVVEDSMHA